jgi:sarcosine oxidase delta subunit
MKTIKVTLCPRCGECPEVEITESGVTIGEDANIVKLTHDQWNDLVARIRQGDLREV